MTPKIIKRQSISPSPVNSVYIDDMNLDQQQHSMILQQQKNSPQLKQNPANQNSKLIQKS
jgi:hypothetical protein